MGAGFYNFSHNYNHQLTSKIRSPIGAAMLIRSPKNTMLPKIEILLSIEIIRDGGSLAIDFESDNNHWSLFFGIIYNEKYETTGYKTPQLINRSVDITHDITWEHAKFYLNNINQSDLSEAKLDILQIISKVISNKGDYLRPIQSSL